ncbi:MAG: type IIL restriction-modification enzyme MmeI [Pseudomonadales bacterium]
MISRYPDASSFIRKFIGADEFINNGDRYCLWLKDTSPSMLKRYPEIVARLDATRNFRLSSDRPATRELASTPSQFAFVSHEESSYIIVPSVSSERRQFIPVGFMSSDVIASNLCLIIPNASLFHFGVLTSTMHNAWMRTVCGRLKSDYRYSAGIMQQLPWPENPSEKQKQAIETAAQAVLDARLAIP